MDTTKLHSLSVAALSALQSNERFSEAYVASQFKKYTGIKNVIGQTPNIPKQPRNAPCGCGSGKKAKKCCGNYPRVN